MQKNTTTLLSIYFIVHTCLVKINAYSCTDWLNKDKACLQTAPLTVETAIQVREHIFQTLFFAILNLHSILVLIYCTCLSTSNMTNKRRSSVWNSVLLLSYHNAQRYKLLLHCISTKTNIIQKVSDQIQHNFWICLSVHIFAFYNSGVAGRVSFTFYAGKIY